MAAYAVAAGERGVHAKTLTASVVDTVTFAGDVDKVEIIADGTADLYITVDGSDPTVGGNATWRLPAGGASVREVATNWAGRSAAGGTVVKLISVGAVKYSVAEASS